MKIQKILIVIVALILCGCGGLGNKVSVKNYNDIEPLNYNAQFNVNNSPQNASKQKNNPFINTSTNDLSDIWNDVSRDSKIKNSVDNPKYIFNIFLLATLPDGFFRYSMSDTDYHGGALFLLEVNDNNNRQIHKKIFKIYGLWNSNGMGSNGPATMGMFGTSKAMIKVGLYDILAYICRGDFSKTGNSGTESINHILSGMKVRIPEIKVIYEKSSVLSQKYISEYTPYGVALVYFRYIMAEDIQSEEQLSHIPWKEGSKIAKLWTARIAYSKGYPYFPPQLKLSGEFEVK